MSSDNAPDESFAQLRGLAGTLTNRFTDRLFGTLPADHRDDYARVSAR